MTKRSMDHIVKDLLYPEGEKEDTPQMRSPAKQSGQSSSDEEEWASKAQVGRLLGQLNEMRKFINDVVKKHAKDIDTLKTITRLAQKSSGAMSDDLNQMKFEITQGLSLHDMRLTEVENGYNSLNEWAGEVADKTDPDALWADLEEKESRLADIETKMEEAISIGV